MKTICSLLVTLFITVALVATAGPPPTPTVNIICTGGISSFGCDQPDFSATNLDPSTMYEIDGNATNGAGFTWGPFSANNGTSYDSLPTNGSIDPGTWTFELHAIGNNGNPKHKVLATFGPVTF